ncbi:MAG: putative bifunctional diguanylate cyclase/phosphodiesterase [Angustibacter sp.]
MAQTAAARLPRATWLLRAHFALVAACLLVYVADLGVTVSAAAFVLTGLSTAGAMVVGPRLHRPTDAITWRRLLVVCVLFAIGPAVRPQVDGLHGLGLALPDAFLLPGYVIALLTLRRLLRLRGSRDPDAALDVAVVTVGAALLSISYIVGPALQHSTLPGWTAALVAVYPVLDVVLLALLALLAFTARERTPSLTLVGGAMLALLVGDVGYNLLASRGALTAPPVFDTPYLLAFGLLGAAALHPSMRAVGSGFHERVQAWSWQRLAVLVPALLVPSLLIIPDANLPLVVRWLQAIGSAGLVAAIIVRAGRAVREQSASRRVFEHLATHDALTGLANRPALNERLEQELALGNALNVLFIDLDGFKMVNDSWGHAVGDELLVQVADRLRRHLPPDVVVSRAGGDEFILVTPARQHDLDGTVFAEHVIAELSQPYALTVGDVVVTPSIGVVSSATAGERTADALVRDADTAMYRAKDAGRSRAVPYDPSMGEVVRGRVTLDRALRQALGRGEMDVAFQPLVELATGRLLGFEALARWNRPDGGPCTPDVFIAAAEENGLILPIGDFVLERALGELRTWRSSSPWEVGVNVNVSARQLQDPGFTGRVLAALARFDVPATALRLEVTESTLVGDEATAATSLRELERAGVSISVDDFGTGYSSLSYLSRLKVHEVKIDRSFVAGVTSRPEDLAIVRATAAMAQALGLAVVAEGIETEEQRLALVELGISRGQGWLLGRPVPASAAAELVSREWDAAARRP